MDRKDYLKLFTSTFTLSAFTFGGGYVIIPLMKKKFVEDLKWVDENEMIDLVAIAQSSPGVIAVNTSVILGQKLAGFKGTLIAVFGTVLPPFIILSIISMFYESFKSNNLIVTMLDGMQAGVAAVVIGAAINLLLDFKKNREQLLYNIFLCIVAFIFSFFFHINVIYLIVGAIVIAIVKYSVKRGVKS